MLYKSALRFAPGKLRKERSTELLLPGTKSKCPNFYEAFIVTD
jgi:hypothetical protein